MIRLPLSLDVVLRMRTVRSLTKTTGSPLFNRRAHHSLSGVQPMLIGPPSLHTPQKRAFQPIPSRRKTEVIHTSSYDRSRNGTRCTASRLKEPYGQHRHQIKIHGPRASSASGVHTTYTLWSQIATANARTETPPYKWLAREANDDVRKTPTTLR